MKLKEFNPKTCVHHSGSGNSNLLAHVHINMKTGLFRFNARAAALAGLAAGDQLVVLQDTEDPLSWYIEKVKDGGFELRRLAKDEKTGIVLFNNCQLAHTIAESVHFTENAGKCLVAGIPTLFQKRQLWGLLTAGLVNGVARIAKHKKVSIA